MFRMRIAPKQGLDKIQAVREGSRDAIGYGLFAIGTPFRSYGAWREGGVEQGCLKSRFLRQWGVL